MKQASLFDSPADTEATCKHPAHRLYAVQCNDEQCRPVLWIGCCECGTHVGTKQLKPVRRATP
jgi:hypothetical protein